MSADETQGRPDVPRIRDAWYVVAMSEELSDRPLARRLHGDPLVVFRGEGGQPAALLDRCAHRNVPLSGGQVVDCRIECPYHGWRYDGEGDCRLIPGLVGKAELPRRAVPRYVTFERDGLVWAWGNPASKPEGAPYRPPCIADRRYTTVTRTVATRGSLHMAIENALDVPHTAFLHKGLFRGTGTTNRIKAVVTRDATKVVAEYIGEPRPEGIAAKILSPSGGVVTHFDRFLLPSIAQVEYSIGDENHFIVTSYCTPEEDYFTRMYAVISFRTRVPGALVKPVLEPVANRIFAQDAAMLAKQTDAIDHFGGQQYTSTEIDVLGPQIMRLMRRTAEGRGAKEGDEAWSREVTLEV